MIYRAITREDALAVTSYALDALRVVSADEPMHIAPMKVREAVSFFAKDASGNHFNLAAFEDRICVGAIAAFTAEMTYFERQEAHIMFAHATVPRVGIRLIRELLAWFKREPRLRRITWAMNPGAMGDRMLDVLARRHGFKSIQMLCMVKE